jgi:hypothetical protein
MERHSFNKKPKHWRAPPEDVAEFCAQINRFAETYCPEMGRIRDLGLAGEYQAAHDIVIKLERISKIIGTRRLAGLLSELRLQCSSHNAKHDEIISLISVCEIEFFSLKKLAAPKGKLTRLVASS